MKLSLLCFLLVLCAISNCNARKENSDDYYVDDADTTKLKDEEHSADLAADDADTTKLKDEEHSDDYYVDADVSDNVPDTVTLKAYKNKRIGDNFDYKYAISDGTVHRAKGTIKNINGTRLISVKGHYKWAIGNGLLLSIKYEADENGLRVTKIDTYDGDRNITTKSIANLLG